MLVEYKNAIGKKDLRDPVIGKKESELRKQYLALILPGIIAELKREFGDIFRIKIVGSVSEEMATSESDIDLFIILNESVADYLGDLLVISFYELIDNLVKQQNYGYRIDLWFQEKYNGMEKGRNRF